MNIQNYNLLFNWTGDYEFKPYVCSDADVTTYKISSNDDYIVIACDGFWDVFRDKDVPKLVILV